MILCYLEITDKYVKSVHAQCKRWFRHLKNICWRTSASVILNDQSKRLQQGMFMHRLIWTDSAFRLEAQEIRMVFRKFLRSVGDYAHMCWRWNLGSCDRCVLFHWATSQLSGFNFGISVYNQRMNLWGLVMSQWVKGLATKPDTVSSVPEAHTVKGKNQFLEVALCSPHSLSVMSVLLHTYAYTHPKEIRYNTFFKRGVSLWMRTLKKSFIQTLV